MNKKVYKLWIEIEEISLDENGQEVYTNLKDNETRSVGCFKNLDEAIDHMNDLGEMNQWLGDGQNKNGFIFE